MTRISCVAAHTAKSALQTLLVRHMASSLSNHWQCFFNKNIQDEQPKGVLLCMFLLCPLIIHQFYSLDPSTYDDVIVNYPRTIVNFPSSVVHLSQSAFSLHIWSAALLPCSSLAYLFNTWSARYPTKWYFCSLGWSPLWLEGATVYFNVGLVAAAFKAPEWCKHHYSTTTNTAKAWWFAFSKFTEELKGL